MLSIFASLFLVSQPTTFESLQTRASKIPPESGSSLVNSPLYAQQLIQNFWTEAWTSANEGQSLDELFGLVAQTNQFWIENGGKYDIYEPKTPALVNWQASSKFVAKALQAVIQGKMKWGNLDTMPMGFQDKDVFFIELTSRLRKFDIKLIPGSTIEFFEWLITSQEFVSIKSHSYLIFVDFLRNLFSGNVLPEFHKRYFSTLEEYIFSVIPLNQLKDLLNDKVVSSDSQGLTPIRVGSANDFYLEELMKIAQILISRATAAHQVDEALQLLGESRAMSPILTDFYPPFTLEEKLKRAELRLQYLNLRKFARKNRAELPDFIILNRLPVKPEYAQRGAGFGDVLKTWSCKWVVGRLTRQHFRDLGLTSN